MLIKYNNEEPERFIPNNDTNKRWHCNNCVFAKKSPREYPCWQCTIINKHPGNFVQHTERCKKEEK